MILPIVAYGSKVLRANSQEIDENYPELDTLINNMMETMVKADGVGLAAPQINLSIRLFVIDASPLRKEDESLVDFKKVFINPIILEETGELWAYSEGCLSLPGIREEVKRKPKIRIEYYDENWELKDEYYDGIKARIIQHEYDHLEGYVLTDRLQPLKKRILKGKLASISKGKVSVDYKMKFPK